jgi:transcriptional regulator with PAS, ATPase and Fis domain
MKIEWQPLIDSKVTILILGEPGVGKSTLAKKIHQESSLKNFPFFQLNIAAIHSQIFESELFGHAQGAFTGALKKKIGFCEMVQQGTLFLDEIGELDLYQQAKLLQLLEEKLYYPVGSTIAQKFNGRIILATNKNLLNEVETGRFRRDLWYRIKNYTIQLPSLEDDYQEKIMAIQFWIKTFEQELGKRLDFSPEAINWIYHYKFHGHHREVRQMIEKIYLLLGTKISLVDLEKLFPIESPKSCFESNWPTSYKEAKKIFEKSYLEQQLKNYHGRINQISKSCDISKTSLIQKMRDLRLEREIYEF